jgi:glutamate-5-semialdehyde dehydrogenase
VSFDPESYAHELARAARAAALRLVAVPHERRVDAIRRIALLLRENRAALLDANAHDVAHAHSAGVGQALLARLALDDARIESMAAGVERIANHPDPIGQTIESRMRPDGLKIERRRVPIGVILFIYESRPNVTTDAAALCLKSANAVILRGGKAAQHCNRALARIIEDALASERDPSGSAAGLTDAVQIVDHPDRTLVPALLHQDKHIDLVIPRGGESLIRTVVEQSRIPVLKHFTGNCHIYIDASARSMPAQRVVDVCVNAKTSYPGGAVCNAVEHLIFHKDAIALVPDVCAALASKGVEVRGDERVRGVFPAAKATSSSDWETEYLAFVVGVRVVDSLDEAIDHINTFGSHHTDAILAVSQISIDQFVTRVDSASVMVNASTRLADGGEYGLGAEIGISTDKLHARGPMGASDLTTYKWIITGDGHLRR